MTPLRAWCEGGIRYDDTCVGCGNAADVDNLTDLCQDCFGPPRAPENDPVISLEQRLVGAGLVDVPAPPGSRVEKPKGPVVFDLDDEEYAMMQRGQEHFLRGFVRGAAKWNTTPTRILLTHRGETVADLAVLQSDIDEALREMEDSDW